MARFGCACGETLSNSLCPNDIQLHVFTDHEWDEVIARGKIDDTLELPSPKYDVWKCPKCQKIHVFAGNELIITYAIEKDTIKRVISEF